MKTHALKKPFRKLPLSLAVSTLCFSQAFANTAEPVNLGTLTITSDRQGAKVQTNVVTTELKDQSTATDMRGLLKDEPAIDFGGGNGASQYWTIRGMGQNSIDLKIDDGYSDSQVLYHQGRFTLDPSLVKIVSVQKGAGSASSGIGATNGAIVAKTVDAADLLKDSDKDWGVKVNAGYSSNDEHSYGVAGFAKTDNFDFLISGNRVSQKDYTAGTGYVSPFDGGDKVRFSALDKESYLAKAGIELGAHHITLSHLRDNNKGTRLIREEFDFFDGQHPAYRELSLENTNLAWSADSLGFANRADANVYRMKTTRTSADDSRNGYAGAALNSGETEASIETLGGNLNLETYINDDASLKYGVNYRHQTTTPAFKLAGVTDQEKTDLGAYAELIGQFKDVTVTGGLRYDHFDFTAMDGKKADKGSISPSLGVIWQAHPHLSFSATHNYATRSPRMIDMQLSHGARGIVSVADNIKPERAKNTELGFNYNNGTFSVNGGYFWQRIDDLLNSGSVARHGTATTYYRGIDNVGHATNEGFELNAAYHQNGLTARLGVAESEPKFYSRPDAEGRNITFNSSSFAQRLGRIWTAGLSYRFDKPSLEVGVNHRLAEDAYGQSAWMADIASPNPRANHSTTTLRKGYNVTDLYANWQPYGDGRMNVNFSVNNLEDKFYRSHSEGVNGLPAVGREFRVGFNYTY